MKKYVFIQNEPFYLPKLLDKYLREFCDSTEGINIQSVAQGKRSVFQTALDLYRIYGLKYFQWKLRKYVLRKIQAKVINEWLGSTKNCYSVKAVAKKYSIPVTEAVNVNSDEFREHLRDKQIDLIVSISGTQFYGKKLRDQTPQGIVNCHGALLPKYRGLMPSFWTLKNKETEGGSTLHFVDEKLDNGPIVIQKKYRIHAHDTLEDIMARSKDLAAETIIEGVRLIESSEYVPIENDASQATDFTMPTTEDAKAFRLSGHQFV